MFSTFLNFFYYHFKTTNIIKMLLNLTYNHIFVICIFKQQKIHQITFDKMKALKYERKKYLENIYIYINIY